MNAHRLSKEPLSMRISLLRSTTVRRSLGVGMAGAIALLGHPLLLAHALPVADGANSPRLMAQVPTDSTESSAVPDEPPLGSRNMDTALEEILILLAQDEPPLGSRGNVCAISPGLVGETDIIWGDRPVFVWAGQATRIGLADFATGTEFWSAEPAAPDTQVAYDGEPLQPGQLYRWTLTDSAGRIESYIFEVMEPGERQILTAEFEALNAELRADGLDPQTQLAEQARFFAEKGLWSDTIQRLKLMEPSSQVLGQTLDGLTTYICGEQAAEPQ